MATEITKAVVNGRLVEVTYTVGKDSTIHLAKFEAGASLEQVTKYLNDQAVKFLAAEKLATDIMTAKDDVFTAEAKG